VTSRKAQMSSRSTMWVLRAAGRRRGWRLDGDPPAASDLGRRVLWARSYVSAEAFSDGFAAAIAVSAALSLVGPIAALGLPGRSHATRRPPVVPAVEAQGGA
jgi:hypothetical protein